jgi:hypothetical protein
MNAARSLLALLLLSSAPPAETARPVAQEEILEAMRASRGFDPTATTNGARFQAEVLLYLARRARARQADGPPLFLGHAEWFAAYLARTSLAADKAPAFVRLAYDHGQDMEVDYRAGRVIRPTGAAPLPETALNVRIGWPESRDRPASYSYADTLSTPHLKVTNRRLITYRLLAFGDMVAFGEIEGLHGRPTSGVLGLLFKVIGEGRVEENRMAIAADGLQIARARARKAFFEVATTVTVYPDGRTEKDVPPGRPDLLELEARLKRPLAVAFQPLDRNR